MAYTLNRRLAELIDSNGQLVSGKIANGYISTDHFANNSITDVKLHTSFSLPASALTARDTGDLSEGSNLYYTTARWDSKMAAADTGDLSEGSNLYYTDARVGTYISGDRTFGNITTTGYIAGPATFTIDPAAVGDNTGTVVIAGNLQVDGTTTTINSTTLEVDDLNITLAAGSANSGAANGAGLTVDCGSGSDATLIYNGTLDNWEFNKELRLTTGSFASHVNGNRYIKYRSGYDSTAVADFELKSDNNSAAVARITSTGTADVLQVFDNTTQVVTIADAGKVGIGTDSPTFGKLEVNGSKYVLTDSGQARGGVHVSPDSSATSGQYGGAISFSGGGSGSAAIASINDGGSDHDSVGLAFITHPQGTGSADAEEKMRITEVGNVGIGTDSPSALLHLKSTVNAAGPSIIFENTNNAQAMNIDFWNNAGALQSRIQYSEGPASFNFIPNTSNNNSALYIAYDGKVGIGTTSPTGKLTIANPTGYAPNTITAANSYIQLGSTDYGSGGSSSSDGKFMIGFGYTDGTTNTHSPAYIGFEEETSAGDTAGQLTFYTRGITTDTAPTQRMVIGGTGKVQIWHGGTTYYTSFEDNNEINTYTSGGAYSTMYLQHPGGDLNIGAGILFVDRSESSVGIGTTAVTSPGLWYDGANDYLAISHWASPPTPSAMLHLSDNSNDLDVPQIRIEGRENPGDTRLDISVKDAAVRLNLIEGASDASNGFGQMIFKTNAAANTGAVNRGGFKFDTPASSNSLVVTNTAGIGFGTDNPFSFGGGDFEFYDAASQTGVRITSSASSFEIGTDTSGGYIQSITPGDGMRFYTANSSAADVIAMEMNSVGIVTTPQNPAFRAWLSTERTTNGDFTSGWTDSGTNGGVNAYDVGNDFNASNGRFTAPVSGVYHFDLTWDSNASDAQINMYVVGTGHSGYLARWEPTGASNQGWETRNYSTDAYLEEGDYLYLIGSGASGTHPFHMGAGYWGYFCGHLVG